MARARVLISDLDGTLVGDDHALGRFAAWRATDGRDWRLVYATGRSAASVMALVEGSALPRPDALITEVGTVVGEPGAAPWPDWPPPLARWDAGVVREALDREPGLVPQAEDVQSAVKVSYYAGVLGRGEILRLLRMLRGRGVDARLVHSVGRFLDVLPRSVGKRAAARHVLATWGIEPEDVVTAGDSGNDRDLLRLGHGIVVGNAARELRHLCGPRIVHATGSHADGVLEGLRIWRADDHTTAHHADAAPAPEAAGGRAS